MINKQTFYYNSKLLVDKDYKHIKIIKLWGHYYEKA